jgi:hypothetical protein
MRYTRKNISELLETVSGSPDVTGFATTSAMLGSTYVMVASAGGTAWQDMYNPSHRICEDGTTPTAEDAGRVQANCTVI